MRHHNIPTIETERLLLREITPEVLEMIFNSYSDEELIDFYGFHLLAPTPEEAMALLVAEREKNALGRTTFSKSFLYFFLIEKHSGQNIGWCGFHTWYLPHRRAEIGYGLNFEKHKRQGLMSEAIKPIIQYGFDAMNLNRIEAFASPANTGSIRLLENAGFKEEGLLRNHYFKNEIFEDSAVWGLVRADYETQ